VELNCPVCMERTGIEPVTSGLQTHLMAQLHLTPTCRMSMFELKNGLLVERHSTPFDGGPLAPRSHGWCLDGQLSCPFLRVEGLSRAGQGRCKPASDLLAFAILALVRDPGAGSGGVKSRRPLR
jgi:hypothetical protein